MSTQRGLFDPKSREAPYSNATTSKAAAKSIAPSIGALAARVLDAIRDRGDDGATCDELEQRMKLSHQTTSARVRELHLLGEIFDTKTTRPTRSGRAAIVWRVSPSGDKRDAVL